LISTRKTNQIHVVHYTMYMSHMSFAVIFPREAFPNA
jgi:hypothetical protein